MRNNTTMRFLALLGAVLLVGLFLGAACGGDSDSGEETPRATGVSDGTALPAGTSEPSETAGPDATALPDENGSVGDAPLEDDPVADDTRRTIRDIERSVRKLNSLIGVLGRRIGRGGHIAFGTPEEPVVDWFDECCNNSLGDFDEELRDISRSLPELVDIYEEAGDQESLGLVERIGAEAANINASLSVLASLPSRETAPGVLEEITLEITALADAVTNLR